MIHLCCCPHISSFNVTVSWSNVCQDALTGCCTGKMGFRGREIRLGGAQEHILEIMLPCRSPWLQPQLACPALCPDVGDAPVHTTLHVEPGASRNRNLGGL